MTSINIDYRPPPTVRRFMRSKAFVRAIVGPIGSGKSSGCVMEFIRRAAAQAPGPDGLRRTRFAAIRNTRPQLKSTTRKTFDFWLGQPLESAGAGWWNETDFTYVIEMGDIRSEVMFLALDRPGDVSKVLSLELTGAYINEAREISHEIFDGLQGRVGRYPSMAQGGCSWDGVWMDTNPWAFGSWGHDLFSVSRPPGHELFEQPSGLGPNAENLKGLKPGYYERLKHGKSTAWVEEYLEGKYPRADQGSVFGAWIAQMETEGRISDFSHEKAPAILVLDLGRSDSTSIFWCIFGPQRTFDVVEWYECEGRGSSHVFKVIREMGYPVQHIFLPHDARQRTFATELSTLDQFMKEYPGKVSLVPSLTVAAGIDAGRWLMEQPHVRIHSRIRSIKASDGETRDGIKKLRNYRFEFNEDRKVYTKEPLHDLNSHIGDDWRYVGCVYKHSEFMTRPKEPEKPPAIVIKPPTFHDALSGVRPGPRRIG